MNLAKPLLEEIDRPGLSVNERAVLRCRLARNLEEAGDYEAASEALAELWQGVGSRPMVAGLDDETRAEVSLRVGALTGWIGSASQIEGSQEMAKDLISESLRAFEQLGQRSKVGEARSDSRALLFPIRRIRRSPRDVKCSTDRIQRRRRRTKGYCRIPKSFYRKSVRPIE